MCPRTICKHIPYPVSYYTQYTILSAVYYTVTEILGSKGRPMVPFVQDMEVSKAGKQMLFMLELYVRRFIENVSSVKLQRL